MNVVAGQFSYYNFTAGYARLGADNVTSSSVTLPASVTLTTGLTFKNASETNEAIVKLWLVVSPILLVVGLVGNSLVLATMTRQAMSGTSTCIYLVAMAVLDSAVLLMGLIPDWLAGASIIDLKVSSLHLYVLQYECRVSK